MNVEDFRRMYVIELQELRSVEDQLVEALPRMAALVQHPELRAALNSHWEETKRQRDRLDQLLREYGVDQRDYEDGSMRAIIREAERWAKMVLGSGCSRCRHHRLSPTGGALRNCGLRNPGLLGETAWNFAG